MRFFALSALASIAFGVFCSAAPTPSGLPVVNVPSSEIAARDVPAPNGLQTALNEFIGTVSPLKAQVDALKTPGAVVANVTPILNVVLGALKKVIAAVNALAVQPVENIVYDGVLVDLGNVIRVVVVLLQEVYNIVEYAVWTDLLPLVTSIVGLLGDLVSLLVTLVGAVLGDVVKTVLAEVSDLVNFIVFLNIAKIVQVLGISQ